MRAHCRMNPDQIKSAKEALRRRISAVLSGMTPEFRAAASARARGLLRSRPEWMLAGSVLFFASMAEEVDLWPLVLEGLQAGKTVALPRYDPVSDSYAACVIRDATMDVRAGHFGIREPRAECALIAGNRLDLILVPGVAFDLQGRRLGRGKGYYDRWLAALRGRTCGVAFDEQIMEDIPFGPQDVLISCILTPTRWIEP